MSEREIVCAELGPALDGLKLDGFRLDVIYPADDPHTALLSKGAEAVRLTTRPGAERPSGALPPFVPEFRLSRSGGASGTGRAGMLYRDLVPSRLGGRYIASHIGIPDGGPVSDWVHYHQVAFQMIYARRGWVRLAYEDEGEPFVMEPGDFVLQPALIRHRVLESSPGFEVVEISAPAMHETFADHCMTLPNGADPDRMFGDQRFLHHVASTTPWTPFGGGEAQESAMVSASAGRGDVRTVRPTGGPIDFAAHDGELVFGFVLDGRATLEFDGNRPVAAADSFVIPPHEAWRISGASDDFRLLHVTTARLD